MARSPAMVSSIGIELVGLDRQLAAVQGDHQFAEVFAILPGLDHGRAAVDDDRLVQFGVAVGADDHVDARHGLGQAHVLAVGEASVLAFLHAAVAERDDHVHLLRLAEELHHLPGGLDGIGELHRAGAAGIELRFFAEQSEDAKAHAAALDHDVAADHAILGQTLETGQRWRRSPRSRYSMRPPPEPGRPWRPPRWTWAVPSGPRSKSWLPKVVASQPIRDRSCSSPPVSRVAAANAVPML